MTEKEIQVWLLAHGGVIATALAWVAREFLLFRRQMKTIVDDVAAIKAATVKTGYVWTAVKSAKGETKDG
jgi:hypothetical protein